MIVVEELAVDEDDERDIERWERLGARLAKLDPARFRRVLEIAAGYVSIYEHPEESEDVFQARLRRALGRGAA